MISIEYNIRQNFNCRLRYAQESFDRLRDKKVMKKLIELHDVSSISLYDLFHKIWKCGFEDSLESFENLLSIVGNFYDDSFFKVVWEVPEVIKSMRKHVGEIYTDKDKKPYIVTAYEDCRGINEEEFCNIIQWYIDRNKTFHKAINCRSKSKCDECGISTCEDFLRPYNKKKLCIECRKKYPKKYIAEIHVVKMMEEWWGISELVDDMKESNKSDKEIKDYILELQMEDTSEFFENADIKVVVTESST